MPIGYRLATPSDSKKLYGFFRAGTWPRLRIALRLKGLQVDYVSVDLRNEQHLTPECLAMAHNRVQYQPGLSLREFFYPYGLQGQCEALMRSWRCPAVSLFRVL